MRLTLTHITRALRYALLLCVSTYALNAATLKQIQTYVEQDKLDVLLLLDSAFSGEVGTASVHNEKMTMISHITSKSKWNKAFPESPIKKLEIIPNNGNLYFKVESRKRYYVKPSVSQDKNTLRLSFFTADSGMVDSLLKTPTTLKPAPMSEVFANTQTNTQQTSTSDQINTQETQKPQDSLFSFSDEFKQNLNPNSTDIYNYWYYIAIFIVILAALLYIRKRISKAALYNDGLKLISQTQLDAKNKVIIIEAKECYYMVLLGEKGNVLLDKILKSTESSAASSTMRASIANQASSANRANITQDSTHRAAKLSHASSPNKRTAIGDDKAFNDDFWNALKNAK